MNTYTDINTDTDQPALVPAPQLCGNYVKQIQKESHVYTYILVYTYKDTHADTNTGNYTNTCIFADAIAYTNIDTPAQVLANTRCTSLCRDYVAQPDSCSPIFSLANLVTLFCQYCYNFL